MSDSDHPDIENLPLEIDGIAVRETLRAFFRNTDHGTPDNISKAGCLALAIKSNEVGGKGKGHVLWNVWREAYPTRAENRKCQNNVDFAYHDFNKNQINFSGFRFGDVANFESAKWGGHANFNGAHWGDFATFYCAEWGHNATFIGAKWGYEAYFNGAQWGNGSNFNGAQWEYGANFVWAKWGHNANFIGAQWGEDTYFIGAQWVGKANFNGAQWGGCACFIDAQWGNDVVFSASTWTVLREFYPDTNAFEAAQVWAKERGVAPDTFDLITFTGARFGGQVFFNNRRFLEGADFSHSHQRERVVRDAQGRAVISEKGKFRWELDPDQAQFLEAPQFHGCELHQDTSFEGANFPEASGSEEAARAYRTLKLAFSKQQAIREEQRFFRLEMAEETLREKGLKRWLFQAYKTTSDYGFSVTRPLASLGFTFLFFTAIYGLLSCTFQCTFGAGEGRCPFEPQWLEFSLLQTFPLPGLDKLTEDVGKTFWPESTAWSLALSALVVLHKTISLGAIFLIGLALRNLFKLK